MAKSTAFQAVNVGSNPITRFCKSFNLFEKTTRNRVDLDCQIF